MLDFGFSQIISFLLLLCIPNRFTDLPLSMTASQHLLGHLLLACCFLGRKLHSFFLLLGCHFQFVLDKILFTLFLQSYDFFLHMPSVCVAIIDKLQVETSG
jgi:hypothetical protein